MDYAKTAQKLREQMVLFSGELSAGLPKVARRFVAEMVFGIPDFRLYALADGIRQFLYSQTRGLKGFLDRQRPLPVQPTLFNP
jgi:hypothetical protein